MNTRAIPEYSAQDSDMCGSSGPATTSTAPLTNDIWRPAPGQAPCETEIQGRLGHDCPCLKGFVVECLS